MNWHPRVLTLQREINTNAKPNKIMKTLLSILNGDKGAPRFTVRQLGLGLVYALGLSIILLQLRSII